VSHFQVYVFTHDQIPLKDKQQLLIELYGNPVVETSLLFKETITEFVIQL
jgi:hypothetical protein